MTVVDGFGSIVQRAIQDIDVGDRVASDGHACTEGTVGDHVVVDLSLPGFSDAHVRLLRPKRWIGDFDVGIGTRMRVHLEELGVSALGEIVAIQSREVGQADGCLVTATTRIRSTSVVLLRFVDGTELELTPGHPLFSITRSTWVSAASLIIGELVRTRQGAVSVAEVLHAPHGEQTVFNLEVEGQHRFFVGPNEVLAHNTNPIDCDEGIYEFPDQKAPGKMYVGQSNMVSRRLREHERAGRRVPGTEMVTPVPGGKTKREIAEHTRLREHTMGVPARDSDLVSNRVDPIGPMRQHLLNMSD